MTVQTRILSEHGLITICQNFVNRTTLVDHTNRDITLHANPFCSKTCKLEFIMLQTIINKYLS
jgi:hypothetical protein